MTRTDHVELKQSDTELSDGDRHRLSEMGIGQEEIDGFGTIGEALDGIKDSFSYDIVERDYYTYHLYLHRTLNGILYRRSMNFPKSREHTLSRELLIFFAEDQDWYRDIFGIPLKEGHREVLRRKVLLDEGTIDGLLTYADVFEELDKTGLYTISFPVYDNRYVRPTVQYHVRDSYGIITDSKHMECFFMVWSTPKEELFDIVFVILADKHGWIHEERRLIM